MSDLQTNELEELVALNELLKGPVEIDVPTRMRELRDISPVWAGKLSHTEFGMPADININAHDESRPAFSVLSFEGVTRVLTDTETFSIESYVESLGRVMDPPNLLMMDGEAHRRQRAFLNPIFSPSRFGRWLETEIKPVISESLDRLTANGPRADLMADLCLMFPFTILRHLLGLQEAEGARFHRLAMEIVGGSGLESMRVASAELGKDIRAEIARRRSEPGEDLVSALVNARIGDDSLSEDEILGFLKLLFPAGAETTARASANLLTALLTHPEQMEAVRANRGLVAAAIEESLRWESPVAQGSRMAMLDVELEGTFIPKGAIVYFYEGAANRDPKRYENPDRFDIMRRQPLRHLAFGHMRHLCLGQALSRLEIATLLNAVFDRFPRLRLDPDVPFPTISGVHFRSPAQLKVLLD